MNTLSVGVVSVELPADLQWPDEFGWTAVQASDTRSITGARILQTGLKVGGRPITLQPPDDSGAWAPRSVVEQCFAWSQIEGLELTLSFRGVARAVEFRSNEAPVEARAVFDYSDPDPADPYLMTLRLLEK